VPVLAVPICKKALFFIVNTTVKYLKLVSCKQKVIHPVAIDPD